MRRKRRISAEPNVSTGLSSLPFQVWLQNRKTSWRESRNKRDKATATKKRKSVEEDEVVATSDRLAKRPKKMKNQDSLSSASSPWDKLTVAELKAHLKEQNLPVSGLKADLIQRLEENEVVVDEQLLQSVKKNTPKKKSAPKKKMLASKPTKSVVGKGRRI